MTETPHQSQELYSRKRVSWRQKTPEEIRTVIQEYANPANDTKLTHWSAKRLIGAILRVEHDYEPYNGFEEDYFYNPLMNDDLVKSGRWQVAPIRRIYRRLDAEDSIVLETEIKYMSVSPYPDLIIQGTQYWGAMHRFGFGADKTRELIHQEVLLSGRLQFWGQSRPKWVKLEPNRYFENYFSTKYGNS